MKEIVFPVVDSDGNIFNRADLPLSVRWTTGGSVESNKIYHLVTIGAPSTVVSDGPSPDDSTKVWISAKAMECAPVGLLFDNEIYVAHPTWNTAALVLVEDRTESSAAEKKYSVIEKVQDSYGNLYPQLDIPRSLYSLAVTESGTTYEAEGVPTTITVPSDENWIILRAEPEYPTSAGDEFLVLDYGAHIITISAYQDCFVPLKSGTTYTVSITSDVGNELYNLIILRDSRYSGKGAYGQDVSVNLLL